MPWWAALSASTKLVAYSATRAWIQRTAPEFTTLECYEAYADQYVMAERMQEIIVACAQELGVTAD